MMGNVSGWLGTLLLYLSFAAYFIEEALTKYLPENIATMIVENKVSILGVAVVLIVIGIIEYIKKNQEAKQKQDIEPVSTQTKSSRVLANDANVFQVDQQQLAQHCQTDPQLMKMAASTSWEPLLAGGGINVKHVQLKQVNPLRVEVVRSAQLYPILGLTIVMGMVLPLGLMMHNLALDELGANMETIFPIVFALIFACVGFAMMYYPRPRVFDKKLGWFWLGKKALTQSSDIRRLKQHCQLSDIMALQLLSEHITGDDISFTSYELNLVLRDGSRLNVMDHGDKLAVTADTKMLSDFLAVPILQ